MVVMMKMMMMMVVRAKNIAVQNVSTLYQHYPINSMVLTVPYTHTVTQSYYPGSGGHEAMPCY